MYHLSKEERRAQSVLAFQNLPKQWSLEQAKLVMANDQKTLSLLNSNKGEAIQLVLNQLEPHPIPQ